MVTDTKDKILDLAIKNGRVRPVEIVRGLNISQAATQRQLKKLVENGKLVRKGNMPKVYYEPVIIGAAKINFANLAIDKEFIDKNYLYVSADGRLITGWAGLQEWATKIGEAARIEKLAAEYKQTRLEANNFVNINGWIEATKKINTTFEKPWLDEMFYSDFYSLPKFGKTKFGQMVLYAKQSQNIKLIDQLSDNIGETIERLLAVKKIDAVGFVPHSVPRKVQFLVELEKRLNIKLPTIELEKSYSDIVVPQKTLSSLKEREENARKTILLWNLENKYENVLLIDDAVGSGATMNETAKKLVETGVAKKVIGYAVVGSIKGFEVIKEV